MELVHECFECGAQFTVQGEFDIEDQDVSFCPYCGTELDFEPDEDLELEDDED